MAKRIKKPSGTPARHNFFRTELYKIFDSFTSSERKELAKAAASPFFNESQDLVRLVDWLLFESHRHTESSGKEVNEQIAKAVFPELRVDIAINKIPTLRVKCLKFLSEFIVLSACRNDTVLSQITLRRFFHKKGHWEMYEEVCESFDDTPASASIDDLAYAQVWFQRDQYQAFINQSETQTPLVKSLNKYPEALLHWFLTERLLQMFIPHILVKELAQEAKDFEFQEEILIFVSEKYSNLPPEVRLMYHLLQSEREAATNQKYNHALLLLNLWEQYPNSLTTFQEFHAFHQLCRLYSQKVLDEPDRMEGKELLERIFRRMNSVHIDSMGGLPSRILINVVTALSQQERYQEAIELTKQFSALVKPPYRENTLNLADFIVLTKRADEDDLKKAMDIYPSLYVSRNDELLDCLLRIGMCKVYYQYNINRLHAHLEAFRKTISRWEKRGVHAKYVERFKPFVSVMKSLKILKEQGTTARASDIETLFQYIATNTKLLERKWLESAVQKLIALMPVKQASTKAPIPTSQHPQNFS